jgi:uncharacterized protein
MQTQQRYYSFTRYLLERYGEHVDKISIDAGFTCPNRDGRRGHGGCSFCRVDSFSEMESTCNISVAEQIEKRLQKSRQRGVRKQIIYFQASTNTDASAEVLRPMFEQAIAYPGVVGLAIATRPDSIFAETVQLLDELTKKVDIWVELGLQSIHDQTLQKINRGHTFADYQQALQMLAPLALRICCHLMLGLPGENHAMMMQTATTIAASPIHEIKLHPMLVLRKTAVAQQFAEGCLRVMELEEYADTVVDFLERLAPHIVIQRLTAEARADLLIAPLWSIHKAQVLQTIQKTLEIRDTRQGCLYGQLTIS